ncbi:unnamed protein product [Staurois parvus]|uniref:Uncharacterized protein n=1 Tax=Staurois parvus TaxID=386267 RepID=A0ABN9G8M3_9NEOB|nr:unnamed protein product [Staurois parvus]
MYVKWFDTVMFYYVILVNLVNVTFCHFQISRPSVPVSPRHRRERNPEDRCRRTLQGTLQAGGHRGSAGQGKRRRDPGAAPHGKPECSSVLPLVLH